MSNYVGNVPVQPVGVRNGSALPASGSIGEIFYNTSSETLFVFNGAAWSEAVGGAGVSSGTTLPSPVQIGQLFFLSTEEKVYVGTTVGWEPLQGANFGTGLPVSGNVGDLFFNTNTQLVYVWAGSSWNQIGGASSVNSGATTPASGSTEGELFYNTTSDELLIWSGTAWVQVTSVTTSSLIQTGATLPGSGVAGELFFQTSDNSLYVRSDGAWVSVMPGATETFASLPASGEVGQLIFNTADENVFVWDGTDWVIVGGAATQSSLVVGTDLPGSGAAGELFFQTSDSTLYVYDGTDWVSLQDGSGTGVQVGATLPVSGSVGDLFFETGVDQLYVFTSTGWISLQDAVSSSGTSFPASPEVGQTFFNTTEGVLNVWDGSNWVAQGGGSSSEIGVNSGYSVAQTATTSFSNIFATPSTSGRRYILTSLHATNINTTQTTVSARIDYSATSITNIATQLPIPTGASVELLKQPKVLQPTDILAIQSTENGAVSIVATYNDISDTSFFGLGAKILNTNINTVYTAPSRTRLDSILLVNVGGNDAKVTATWTNSANAVQAFFSFEMVVPANGTIELLQQSKVIPSDHRIRVESDYENTIDVHIAGKR